MRTALEALSDTVAALDALEAGRPGGAEWLAARELDRAAVIAGNPPTRLAKVIAGDGARYGTALGLAATVADRGRPVVPTGLAEAASNAALQLLDPLRTVVHALSRALVDRKLSDAHKHRDSGVVVLQGLALYQAVARWSQGEVFEVASPALPRDLFEAWMDATEELDQVPTERSWRRREQRAEANAAFNEKLVKSAQMWG